MTGGTAGSPESVSARSDEDRGTASGFRKGGGGLSGQYAVEVAGLAWLAEAGPAGIDVVGVREVGSDHLVLERIATVSPDRAAAERAGRALAATHAAGAPAFGAPPPGWTGPGYIGRQRLSLEPDERWGRFYAEQRCLPYARAAHEQGTLSDSGRHAVERVCSRLVAGDFDDDLPPQRIHGDLWAGNLLYQRRTTTIAGIVIDPAAHGGHGLTDLAMLALFGTPHLAAFCAGYAEAAGLEHDWADLIGLHQLHPLLVHAVTHDAAYGDQAERIARRYR